MHWPTKRKQTKPHAESPETAQQPQGKPAQSGAMTCTVHMKAKKPKTKMVYSSRFVRVIFHDFTIILGVREKKKSRTPHEKIFFSRTGTQNSRKHPSTQKNKLHTGGAWL